MDNHWHSNNQYLACSVRECVYVCVCVCVQSWSKALEEGDSREGKIKERIQNVLAFIENLNIYCNTHSLHHASLTPSLRLPLTRYWRMYLCMCAATRACSVSSFIVCVYICCSSYALPLIRKSTPGGWVFPCSRLSSCIENTIWHMLDNQYWLDAERMRYPYYLILSHIHGKKQSFSSLYLITLRFREVELLAQDL